MEVQKQYSSETVQFIKKPAAAHELWENTVSEPFYVSFAHTLEIKTDMVVSFIRKQYRGIQEYTCLKKNRKKLD